MWWLILDHTQERHPQNGSGTNEILRPLLAFGVPDRPRNSLTLKTDNTVADLKARKKSFFDHLKRIDMNRLQRLALQYQPTGKRDIGRPRRRCKDQERTPRASRKQVLGTKPYKRLGRRRTIVQTETANSSDTTQQLMTT